MPSNSIPPVASAPVYESDEDAAWQDADIIRDKQDDILRFIWRDDGQAIENYLTDPVNKNVALSSGTCPLLQLLERCEPPLMQMALGYKRFDALHALIRHMPAATVDMVDIDGNTPLMWAAEEGRLDDLKLLLAAGAVADAANHKGETSLMLAAVKGFAKIVAILLGHARLAINPTSTKHLANTWPHATN